MNTTLKKQFLTFISFKLARKGRSVTKKLFKFQISEDSAVITPLAPRTPLYELFSKRSNRRKGRLSNRTRCIVVLQRRLRRKEEPFQVLRSGDLNRLFCESDSTPKAKPRKLFSKTPKIKSLLLKLKSRKSRINNKLNAVISDDSDVQKPLGAVVSHVPGAVVLPSKARALKGGVSKLKRKLISLKRRSQQKKTPFQVLRSGDLNRLFCESDSTPKAKPRKLFSKTPKIKSLLLKLKSRKSRINNKLNAVISDDSDVQKPLGAVVSHVPGAVVLPSKARALKGGVSKLKRKLISLKRRSQQKKTPFQVLRSGDLNRLFCESDSTPKAKPRKLFSKTPKIKSLLLKLKSRKSRINNKLNAVISDDSDVQKPLGAVVSHVPGAVVLPSKARALKGGVSKLKRKLISLKRRSQQKKTPFQVLRSGDLNRLFCESDSTPKAKPRKLFSKTPKIKSLLLKLKSRKSRINNKLNAVISDDSDVQKTSKRKHNKLRKYFSRMKARWSLKFQKLTSPILTFDESLHEEYKDVIRLLEQYDWRLMPKMNIRSLYTELITEPVVEECEVKVHEFSELGDGHENASDNSEIVENDEMAFEPIEESEIEQGTSLDVLFEGNLDLKLQFFHEEELTERFMNEPSLATLLTARFGLWEPESPEQEKPQGEGQPVNNEPINQLQYPQEPVPESQCVDELFESQSTQDYLQEKTMPESQCVDELFESQSTQDYLQEKTMPESQCVDELFESQSTQDYPQEERLDEEEALDELVDELKEEQPLEEPSESVEELEEDQPLDELVDELKEEQPLDESSQPAEEQPTKEHTEESPKLELPLEESHLEGKRTGGEKDVSSLNDMKLSNGELSILSELADVISTDESVCRPLHEDDESSCSTNTFRKEDWSWYYERQETPDHPLVIQQQPLEETVDIIEDQLILPQEFLQTSQSREEQQPLDEPQSVEELEEQQPLDEPQSVDEPHLPEQPLDEQPVEELEEQPLDEQSVEELEEQQLPEESLETSQSVNGHNGSGPDLPLDSGRIRGNMGLLNQYGLIRDPSQTTRASIDIMNCKEGPCSWYYIPTTYEERYNTAHFYRTGRYGVIPASKTILESDYMGGLLKDIKFKTLILRTMLSNMRSDLTKLSQASMTSFSSPFQCHLSPSGIEELLYKIGYHWDMTKSRLHEIIDHVALANELASIAEYIPDDVADSVDRINRFLSRMRNEYDSVMETMRVTNACVLFDLNKECKALRKETVQQGRAATKGCNHRGQPGRSHFHMKAHESMYEHFSHINGMLTALQRTIALRKKMHSQAENPGSKRNDNSP